MKKFIEEKVHKVVKILRRIYYFRLKMRLKNTEPTIISNNCFGGYVYKNLGLKYMSPTVNLSIKMLDFLEFANNLEGYLSAELTEASADEESEDYPVGKLVYNGHPIYVHFLHYRTFEDAADKWNRRKTRVNYDNLYIIVCTKYLNDDCVQGFADLPYEHKMLISGRADTGYPGAIFKDAFSYGGEILKYKSDMSIKRPMDDIDYVGFLNS